MAIAAGCDGAPTSGIIDVANLATSPASFYWQSPGVLGTPLLGPSGAEPVAACSLYARSFPPGDQQLTITSAQATLSLVLRAPTSGQLVLLLVIRPDGTITETAQTEAPASPYCRG